MSDEDLSHFGVKGMKWGVRKEEEPAGRKPAAKPNFTPLDKQVLDAAGMSLADSPSMKAKYGPDSLSKDPPTMEEVAKEHRLSPAQKKVLIGAGAAVVAVGGLYLLGKYGPDPMDARLAVPGLPATPESKQSIRTFFQGYAKREAEWSPDSLSTSPIHLAAGSIVKRISSKKEDAIRPGGFYAAFQDDDVARYKAVLPIFWKHWGVSAKDGGYIVHLRAKRDINAPSPRQAYDMFHSMVDGMEEGLLGTLTRMSRDEDPSGFFQAAAANWNNENDPLTKRFFSALRQAGYNAVPDLNDAGKLAELPMRFIDGSLFTIDRHEPLSPSDIIAAQEKLTGFGHAFLSIGGLLMSDITRDEALAHFGVKGMRWGVRKAYAERQRKQTAHIRRVAEGTGSGLDKARAAGNLGLGSVAKRGLQGAAQKRVDKQEAYLNRLETGNEKVTDLLAMYGTIGIYDIAKGRKRVA